MIDDFVTFGRLNLMDNNNAAQLGHNSTIDFLKSLF